MYDLCLVTLFLKQIQAGLGMPESQLGLLGTAFSPNAAMFVVLQFFARTFAGVESLLAVVVIAEEFGADVRGWGIGAFSAIQSTGAGLAA